jgi:hypothetical protein
MSGRRAVFLLLGLVIALSCLTFAAQGQTEPGAQWLSWSAAEKKRRLRRWFRRRVPYRDDRDLQRCWPIF